MLQYCTQSEESPEATKNYRESPSQTSAKVTSWSRRRSCLRSIGLADARGEASGEAASPLLVYLGQSDDLGATALLAPIRHYLSSGRHRSPPDLAAADPI